MKKVTVVGSINLDYTIRTPRMPQGGETIHTHEVFSAGGGKGANQAVAAARLGADTSFVGATGADEAGHMMRELMEEDHIDLTSVMTLEDTVTGQAFVIVDDNGENRILVHGGANMALQPEMMQRAKETFTQSDIVIGQFEIAMDALMEAFRIAKEAGVMTLLNPAPAIPEVPSELLQLTDIIVPNETETEILTGITVKTEQDMEKAAQCFHNQGIRVVLITLGATGTYYSMDGQSGIIPAFKVDAKDTTAAGDTFIGSFASHLNASLDNIEDAIRFGNKASSIAVQRFGAQPSIPYLEEVTKEDD